MITFAAGDSTGTGYLALPASGRGPSVLVLHAWWGLTQTFKDVCDRLANVGFVAFAPDLYGDKTASTIEEAQALVDQADFQRIGNIADSALDYLRSQPAVTSAHSGVVGFSMGASAAVDLASARPEQIAAVVVFYGAGSADFAASRAAYLGHFVEDDPWEPNEYVQQMQDAIHAAKREGTFYMYPDVSHWFFEPNRPEYHAAAAELAWQRTVAFLGEYVRS